MNIPLRTTSGNLALAAALHSTKRVTVDPAKVETPSKLSPPPADLAERWQSIRNHVKQAAALNEQVAASQQAGSSEFQKNFMSYLKAAARIESFVGIKT